MRHARIAQTESLNAQYQAAGGDYLSASSGANSDFDGTGLVFGLQGYRPIVPLRCGNLDFFGLVRGSVLWGTSASSAVTSSSIYGSGIGSTAVGGAFAEGPRDLTIVEFQTGVQWSRPLAFCNGQAFARLALECLRWQVAQPDFQSDPSRCKSGHGCQWSA